MDDQHIIRELPSHKRNISLDIKTWSSLKRMKKENETFDDVIKELLLERTKELSKDNMQLIKYNRKTLFIETRYNDEVIGVEFEYNDIKQVQNEFTIDLKFKKIFFKKQILNPSIFFGVDSAHKHLNPVYLNVYFRCISFVMEKEFRAHSGMHHDEHFEDIAIWRKIYYSYNLSEDSFITDIEEPLRLSEEEQPEDNYLASIKESPSLALFRDNEKIPFQ